MLNMKVLFNLVNKDKRENCKSLAKEYSTLQDFFFTNYALFV